MYGSGQSESPQDLRAVLERLEDALSRHARGGGRPLPGPDLPLQVMHHSLALMREEAVQLRVLLGDDWQGTSATDQAASR